jgi:asparagine synthase (glutamine-hydrolysing)
MCGICGFAGPRPSNLEARSVLESMCRTITHRGPDDEGIYVSDGAGLGARRLSILDIEGGHQPLSNEDGTAWAAHNGEIYNTPELRLELESRGHRFHSRTDTEAALHAYEEWGVDYARHLRGMFATAVWDGRRQKLVLIRDRLGIKPLYYTLLTNGALVFASELKALLAYPGIPRELEPQALDLFLTLEYIPAPLSIYRNIFKLPAASILEYSQGRTEVRSYWELEPPSGPFASPIDPGRLPDLMDELYALLKESVRLRLLSDVPLGAFLSGGIDSSAIVGIMRELGVSPLKTFSIGFEDQSYNELEHARRVAHRFQTEHEEFILKPQALELTHQLVRHLDEPLGDFSIFPTYLVSQMARRHVTVILSGDGGDEVFGGYEHYQAQKLSRSPWLRPVFKLLPPLVKHFPPSARKKGTWNKLQRYAQGLEQEPELRHFRWMTFLSPQDKHRLYSEDWKRSLGGIQPLFSRPPLGPVFDRMGDFDDTSAELYLDLRTYLADDILVKVDRMSMAASLETRVPLLDHKVVEFLFRLPGGLKLNGQQTKWLFKKTMERLLPRENIYRRKEGFSIPIKHWLRHELKDLMLDYLSRERIQNAGYFQYSEVRRMLDRHLAGRANHSHQLWALLVFEIWREHYLT